MSTTPKRGPGQPRGPLKQTHNIRCTLAGWVWLQSVARNNGHSSVGAWVDHEVSKMRRRKQPE